MSCPCISDNLACRRTIGHSLPMHLIVAWCNESLHWIDNSVFKTVTIMKKCNNNLIHKYVTIQDLIGKEAHAYVKYIIDKYESIHKKELYVFVQGHAPHEIRFPPLVPHNLIASLKQLSPYTGFSQLSGVMTKPQSRTFDFFRQSTQFNPQLYMLRGQFVVRGNRIHSHPVKFWKNIESAWKGRMDYDMELIWGGLFDCFASKKCIKSENLTNKFPIFVHGISECYDR